ncbi:MAG: acylphosphatase, partial [Methanobacteriota archaeon]
VHNVGYRLFLLEAADQMLIPRFDARNVRVDGKEGLIVLIDGEKEQIEKFVGFVKAEKPEKAVVEKIEVEEYDGEIRNIENFRASFNTSQLSKIVQIGLKMVEKQDVTIEKQDSMLGKMDLMLGKQDLMLEKQDSMLGKMDLMLGKQDETLGEIRGLRQDVRGVSSKFDRLSDLLEKRFGRLEDEIEKIKKALARAGIEV